MPIRFRGANISRTRVPCRTIRSSYLRLRRKRLQAERQSHVKAKNGFTMLFVGVCAVRKGASFCVGGLAPVAGKRDRHFHDRGRVSPRVSGKTGTDAGTSQHKSPGTSQRRSGTGAPKRHSRSCQVLRKVVGWYVPKRWAADAFRWCQRLHGRLQTYGKCPGSSVGDVPTLGKQITMLHEDRALLEKLRYARRIARRSTRSPGQRRGRYCWMCIARRSK